MIANQDNIKKEKKKNNSMTAGANLNTNALACYIKITVK